LKSSIVLYKENICILWLCLCKSFQSYKHYANLSSNKPIGKEYPNISYILLKQMTRKWNEQKRKNIEYLDCRWEGKQ
jgi:hypothetical protein